MNFESIKRYMEVSNYFSSLKGAEVRILVTEIDRLRKEIIDHGQASYANITGDPYGAIEDITNTNAAWGVIEYNIRLGQDDHNTLKGIQLKETEG